MKYNKFGSGGCSKKVLLCVVVCVGVTICDDDIGTDFYAELIRRGVF